MTQPRYFPPRPETYRAGFTFVVTGFLADRKKVVVLGKLKNAGTVQGVWKALLTPYMGACGDAILRRAGGHLQAIVNEAVGTAETSDTGLTSGQILALCNPQSALVKDPDRTADSKTRAAETLLRLAQETNAWNDLRAALQKEASGYQRWIDLALELQTYAQEQATGQEATMTDCFQQLVRADARPGELRLNKALPETVLTPLALYVQTTLTGWKEQVNLYGAQAALNLMGTEFATTPLEKVKKNDIAVAVRRLAGVCVNIEDQLNVLLTRTGTNKLTTFASLPKDLLLKALPSFVKSFGGPGYVALCMLGENERKTALTRYGSLERTFLSKAPAGSTVEVITVYLRRSIEGSTTSEGETAIMRKNVKIDLAGSKMSPVSWRPINGYDCPSSFWINEVETDDLCIKHAVEEAGDEPSPGKLSAYFTEMAQACADAGANWKRTGEGNQSIQGKTATWDICVKAAPKGHPLIHHISSGYARSPWRKVT
ncbi:hypothetical protein [Actinoallomurus sp. CA-150999]|uniref:hypothetical protein n=1 Tax=Actinoallomurus sp. CA-150999 TaxID=3239887 RepID=UPI003D8BED0A